MESYVKHLRLSLGLTQFELATQAAVSRMAVLRNEQLCYPTPLPAIIATLSDIIGLSVPAITASYQEDVSKNRSISASEIFNDHEHLIRVADIIGYTYNHNYTSHLFKVWREAIFDKLVLNTSRIYFSQCTSIHPATLSKYESFKTGFPAPIELAFKEMNFPPELIKIFKSTPFNRILR